jgi:hypothetical protein
MGDEDKKNAAFDSLRFAADSSPKFKASIVEPALQEIGVSLSQIGTEEMSFTRLDAEQAEASSNLKPTTIDGVDSGPSKSTTGIGWATAGLNLASAGAGIASGFINASIARTRGEMAQQRAQFNAKMATLTAQNVLAQADEDAVSFLEQVGTKIIGRQRVAHASQNVKVGTGVSKQLESDARAKAQERVVAIKANAQDRAFGLVTAAMDSTAAGEEAMLAARSGAINSILGGSAFGVERASSAMDTYMKSIKGGNNGTSA